MRIEERRKKKEERRKRKEERGKRKEERKEKREKRKEKRPGSHFRQFLNQVCSFLVSFRFRQPKISSPVTRHPSPVTRLAGKQRTGKKKGNKRKARPATAVYPSTAEPEPKPETIVAPAPWSLPHCSNTESTYPGESFIDHLEGRVQRRVGIPSKSPSLHLILGLGWPLICMGDFMSFSLQQPTALLPRRHPILCSVAIMEKKIKYWSHSTIIAQHTSRPPTSPRLIRYLS